MKTQNKLQLGIFIAVMAAAFAVMFSKAAPAGLSMIPLANVNAVGGVAPDGTTLNVGSTGILTNTGWLPNGVTDGAGNTGSLLYVASLGAWTNTNVYPVVFTYTNGYTNVTWSNVAGTRMGFVFGTSNAAFSVTLGTNWTLGATAAPASIAPAP